MLLTPSRGGCDGTGCGTGCFSGLGHVAITFRCRHPPPGRLAPPVEAPPVVPYSDAAGLTEEPRRTGSPLSWGMTTNATSPPKPFRLARQFHGLDLLELDCALGHQVVEVAISRAGDFGAIEIDGERAAMVLLGQVEALQTPSMPAGTSPSLVKPFATFSPVAPPFWRPNRRFLQVQRAADLRCNARTIGLA